MFKDWQDPDFEVYAVNSKSLEKELAQNIGNALEYLPFSVVLVTIFALINGFKLNSWVFSKPFVTCFGIVNAFLSIIFSCGFLFLIGIPWQAINMAMVFLLIGVGVGEFYKLHTFIIGWANNFKFSNFEQYGQVPA